jgi:ribosome recycling factor
MYEASCQLAEKKMQKSIEALHAELAKLRTGRAHPNLLENIMVAYYGTDTPLQQVASIAVADSRTLTVTPWEKSVVPAIEKAIMASDLGLNPVTTGTVLRVPLPALTEERRKDLIRLVKVAGENARVAIRNARRDANTAFKELLKSKKMTEDDERRAEEKVQKVTDDYVKKVDQIVKTKEDDMMVV